MKSSYNEVCNPRVIINISGEIFETFERTLQRYPSTLLGDQEKRSSFYCSKADQYFFNRNRQAFEAILFFYQSPGKLMRPPFVAMQEFEHECNFFQLPCSSINQMKAREGIFMNEDQDEPVDQNRGGKCYKTCVQQTWDFLEKPETSCAAQIFAIWSLLMIAISVIVSCLETLPQFSRGHHKGYPVHDFWFLAELVLNSWFLLELTLRILFTPNRLKFVSSTLNWMDILAVVPYFIVLAVAETVSSLAFLRILRFFRVIRLFRLSKHSKRLEVIGTILKYSIGDLKQLLLCLLLLVVFGGSMLYYAEGFQENTAFSSIPESLWWAIQTVVVLGYGDIVPTSVIGKCLATCLMLFGALTIALPVLSIVMRFTLLYRQNTKDL